MANLSGVEIGLITTAVIFLILFLLILYYWYRNYFNHFWKHKGIPFEKPSTVFRLIRLVHFKKKRFTDIENDLYKKHGAIFGNYELWTPTLVISDLELVRNILIKDFNVFSRRRDVGDISKLPYLCDSLVAIEGERWTRLRNIVAPAFTSDKLKGMLSDTESIGEQFAQNVLKAAESEEPLNCKMACDCFVMDTISKAAFGTDLDSLNDPNNVFVQNARKAFNYDSANFGAILFFVAPKLCVWLGIEFANFSFFGNLSRSIIARRKENNEVRQDFLQTLMDRLEDSEQTAVSNTPDQPDKEVISMDELLAQCVGFFLAGFDNVATTISLTMQSIAMNPEIQEKVINDVDNYWINKGDEDFTTSSSARYLEACISEALRLYPTLTRTERRPNVDYPLGDTGFTVPKIQLFKYQSIAYTETRSISLNLKSLCPNDFYQKTLETW